MTDALLIFLLTGLVSMSAALSAGALNKLPEADKPSFLQNANGLVIVMVLGNLAALTLIGSLAYGFSRLDWWIPLSCVFITFPVVHLVIIKRLLGDLTNVFVCGGLTMISIPVLWWYW
ncbi:hypothetical protein ADINL_2046 [Nitrincola lacisaponensis]|uniref:Uncharacterized protein n=1 Tax=Nitrincola lacisaponensis TaxID=267850 RepID=A0A063Y337_9GAMM|nr:hypothetical protein [Nitrincola lacisaponensis]KDE38917.1 hypothetical protein ADINL_2046 [Nitrincola lacisaponensis]